jgi:hypothetical protein
MTLPKEAVHRGPHVTTLGATRDEAMAAELLRPMFEGSQAGQLLEGARQMLEQALHARGLALGATVGEPVILYSLSLMDRQVRFEVVRAGQPDEVVMQGCVRLVGRLSFCRVPHDCQISVQLMLGTADASTNFTYQWRPDGWHLLESAPVPVMRRGEHAEVLAGRWPDALEQMTRFIPLAGVASLCADAVKAYRLVGCGSVKPAGEPLLAAA